MRGNSRLLEYLKVGREEILLEVRMLEDSTSSDHDGPEPSRKWLPPCHWEEVYQVLIDAARDHVASSRGSVSPLNTPIVVRGKYTRVAFQFKKRLPIYEDLMLPYTCDAENPLDALSVAVDSWVSVTPHPDMLVAVVLSSSTSTRPPVTHCSTPKESKSSFFTDSFKKRKTQVQHINQVIPESDDDTDFCEESDVDMFGKHGSFSPCAQQLNDHQSSSTTRDNNTSSSDDNMRSVKSKRSQILPDEPLSNSLCTEFASHACTSNTKKSEEISELDNAEDMSCTQQDIDSLCVPAYSNSSESESSPLPSKQSTDSIAVDSDSDVADYLSSILGNCKESDINMPHVEPVSKSVPNISITSNDSPDVHSIFKRHCKQNGLDVIKKRKLYNDNISDDILILKEKKSKLRKKRLTRNKLIGEKMSRRITEYFEVNASKVGTTTSFKPDKKEHNSTLEQGEFNHVLKVVNCNSLSAENTGSDNKIIVLDDDSDGDNGTSSNGHGYDLRHLPLAALEVAFIRNKVYLHMLFKGKFKCHRHEEYKKGGIARRSLNYSIATLPFSNTQLEYLVNLMMKKFCNENNALTFLDYMLKVLLPELATKIFMDKFELNRQEALDKICEVYAEDASKLEDSI